ALLSLRISVQMFCTGTPLLIALDKKDFIAFCLSSSFKNPGWFERVRNIVVSLRVRSWQCSSFDHILAWRNTLMKSLASQSESHDTKIFVTLSLLFFDSPRARSLFITCFKPLSSRFAKILIISSSTETLFSFDVGLAPSSTTTACTTTGVTTACTILSTTGRDMSRQANLWLF